MGRLVSEKKDTRLVSQQPGDTSYAINLFWFLGIILALAILMFVVALVVIV
jgi:hypothetical protein